MATNLSHNSILQPDWFNRDDVQALIHQCNHHDIAIRFVGGCVRDTLMGRPIGDMDVATSAMPERIMAAFEGSDVKIVPTGIQHGTVTLVINGTPFELTTLRVDMACDGRHADVQFTDDWEQDARRRDFTMNALMLAPDGTFYDYVYGVEDARAGRVRFIGDPSARITEDYLRMLRLFRFQATHGQQPLDAEALDACRAHVEGLGALSVERIAQEMTKLLSAPDPIEVLAQMKACGIWPYIFCSAEIRVDALTTLIAHEHACALSPDPWIRLVAIAGDGAIEIVQHWKCSKNVQRLVRQLSALHIDMSEKSVRAAVYRYGNEVATARLLMDGAKADLVALAQSYQPPLFPITGKDLQACGMEEGAELGEALRQLEEAWIASDLMLEKDALLAQL